VPLRTKAELQKTLVSVLFTAFTYGGGEESCQSFKNNNIFDNSTKDFVVKIKNLKSLWHELEQFNFKF